MSIKIVNSLFRVNYTNLPWGSVQLHMSPLYLAILYYTNLSYYQMKLIPFVSMNSEFEQWGIRKKIVRLVYWQFDIETHYPDSGGSVSLELVYNELIYEFQFPT